MMTLRSRHDRGHLDFGWLNTYHTFSFGSYYDPKHMGFRALRVINDDRVAPGAGFPTHSHRDMEIVTYVLSGSLEHKDSLGNGSIIRPGEIQRMSAGTGIQHSEFNPSPSDPVHLLQIWILPEKEGLAPSYEQKTIDWADQPSQLKLIAAPEGQGGVVTIHQDVALYAGRLAAGEQLDYQLANRRYGWLHVAQGIVRLNGVELREGDAMALIQEGSLSISSDVGSEILLFDLA
ncbi:MAG: pirin family protein [Cyanobacteriota bacterium]|nr:pirin family protein [Cyanobacteriota bacterium]